MTEKEIKAEILSDLRQYDETGLIDYRSLDLWIRNEMKRFGNDIMQLTETVVEVKNREADLPRDFWRLVLAAHCSKDGYCIVEGSKDELQNSHFWTERIESTYEWDNQSQSHKQKDYKQIIEREYYKNTAIDFRYTQPTILKLTQGIRRDVCHGDCVNLKKQLTASAQHEINILNNKIQTNFSTGSIYLQYYGLPKNDRGELLIESSNSSVEEYIQYHCKRKIFENLMANNDDNAVGQKLQYFQQQERTAFSRAKTTVKMDALSPDWDKRLVRKNRAETLKYELLYPRK